MRASARESESIVLSPERQWDLTASLVAERFEPGDYAFANQAAGAPIYAGNPEPGVLVMCQARITTRLFIRGDLFVATYHANDVRQPLWGVSSRGYRLRYYWADLFRTRWLGRAGHQSAVHHNDRSRLRWVELPGELVGQHPIDPDVRSYVIETLRAGDSERE
jgi:hypothetical protein